MTKGVSYRQVAVQRDKAKKQTGELAAALMKIRIMVDTGREYPHETLNYIRSIASGALEKVKT